jgi:hypothetical protein
MEITLFREVFPKTDDTVLTSQCSAFLPGKNGFFSQQRAWQSLGKKEFAKPITQILKNMREEVFSNSDKQDHNSRNGYFSATTQTRNIDFAFSLRPFVFIDKDSAL